MTLPSGVTAILDTALKRFSKEDVLWALTSPLVTLDNFPRDGVAAIGGFTANAIPVVVLVDMETGTVFHAQSPERKYRRLFPKQ